MLNGSIEYLQRTASHQHVTANSEDEFPNFSDDENDADNDESSDTASASENESSVKKVKIKVENMEVDETQTPSSSNSETVTSATAAVTTANVTGMSASSSSSLVTTTTSVATSQGGSNERDASRDKGRTEKPEIKSEPDSLSIPKATIKIEPLERVPTADSASTSSSLPGECLW